MHFDWKSLGLFTINGAREQAKQLWLYKFNYNQIKTHIAAYKRESSKSRKYDKNL